MGTVDTSPDVLKSAVQSAERALAIESSALERFIALGSASLGDAIGMLIACRGRIVVLGLGKSGHVGAKIAATLSSTGSPAFFMHGTEALHGDSGGLVPGDVMIALSNSGETAEVVTMARYALSQGIPVICILSKPESTLAKLSNLVIDTGVVLEADPLGLAPTASTTVTIAIGDALASGLMTARNFTRDNFFQRHPQGSLGSLLATEIHEGAR